MKLILASTSPARLSILEQAGIKPLTISPEVDEENEVLKREEELGRALAADEMVLYLARLKAEDVYKRASSEHRGLILGGDSAFLLGETILGKPHEPDVALQRAKSHRGKTGVLLSGHWLIDNTKSDSSEAAEKSAGAVDTATVRLSTDVSDAELEKYVATGEPLELAGGFAIDGKAGAFISKIDGSPSCVMGLSLPILRMLVRRLGYEYVDLWA